MGTHLYRLSGRHRKTLAKRLAAPIDNFSVISIADMIKHSISASCSTGATALALIRTHITQIWCQEKLGDASKEEYSEARMPNA